MHSGLAAIYALTQCPGIGTITANQLGEHTKCKLDELASLPPHTLQLAGLSLTQIKTLQADYSSAVQRLQNWVYQAHSSCPRCILTVTDPDYPPLLRQIPDHPLMLFVEGNKALLSSPQIAIVGARQASVNGKSQAHYFAKELALRNWVITSGLAQGIDAQAHRGALAGGGGTIAVLGHGLAHMYPKQHAELRHKIVLEGGCIISEYPPNQSAKPHFFPQRNRIISGLSMGTFVVEAKHKSGSLITAQQALCDNREVFALPGRIDDANAAGCNALIKQGAILVDQVDDIDGYRFSLEKPQLPPILNSSDKNTQENLSRSDLLDSVNYEITSIEHIAQHSSLPLPHLLARLLEYELSGKVAAVQGGYIKTPRR